MKHTRAFTLIEVLLAITLTLGLVTGLIVFYQYVMEARQAVGAQMDVVAAERIVMERMTAEFRGAAAHPFLSGMEGGADWVSFPTAGVPGRAAWAIQSITRQSLPAECDLTRVTYKLRISEGDAGVSIVDGLERVQDNTQLARTSTEETGIVGDVTDDEAPEGTLLAPHVKMLSFHYHDGYQWLDHWPPTEDDQTALEQEDSALASAESRQERTEIDLPLAVEIVLGLDPLPAGMTLDEYEAEYRYFRRIIYVPAGARPLSGTIIRGLGGTTR